MKDISQLQQLGNSSEFPHQVLEIGRETAKLDVLDQMGQEESIILETSKSSLAIPLKKSKRKQSVMQESVPRIKKKTLKDRSKSLKKNTRDVESSKTSLQESTSKDLVSSPFWNSSIKDMSMKLWSPIKTDCVDLDMKSSNGYLNNEILDSWFSVKIQAKKIHLENCQKTYCQSLTSSLLETMDSEQVNRGDGGKKKVRKIKTKMKIPKKDPAAKARKVRIYPNEEEKKTLKKWFGCSRYIYNRCIDIYEETRTEVLSEYRKRIINNENYQDEDKKWMLEYNYDLRDEALRDFLKNVNTCKAKGDDFVMHHRSKKDQYSKNMSISILSKHWGKRGFFSILSSQLKNSEKLPLKLSYDSRLIRTCTGKYFIVIQSPLARTKHSGKDGVISIDPGTKTFLSGYDTSGNVISIGNEMGRIARLLHYRNSLRSKIKKLKKKTKKWKNHKRAFFRISEKIENLIYDFHNKAAKWLCMNFSIVLIPKLNFHKMRNLNKRCKEKLASLSMCKFVDRFISKSREYNCKVVQVTEEFTTKGCSSCGSLYDVGRSRTYSCPQCYCIMDRDANAAKNILLKYMSPSGR